MRFWVAILLVAGLSACGTIGDDSRYRFGVSADRPTATGSTETLLAWKADQICTTGYTVIGQDTVRTEQGGQIADNHLQCNPYHPSLGIWNVSWASIF
jgi:hypothetical protein